MVAERGMEPTARLREGFGEDVEEVVWGEFVWLRGAGGAGAAGS
jgi:hypothetical protein